jgi:TolA-binding protein
MEIFINWLLPLLSSVIIVFLGYLLGKRKENTDITQKISQTTLELLEPLEKRIAKNNDKIDELEKLVENQKEELELLRPLPEIVSEMARGVDILIAQIQKLGYAPEWTPINLESSLKELSEKTKKLKKK